VINCYNSGTKKYYGTSFDKGINHKDVSTCQLVSAYGAPGATILVVDDNGVGEKYEKKGPIGLLMRPLLKKNNLVPHPFDFLDKTYWTVQYNRD
jgi:hypothetical protein